MALPPLLTLLATQPQMLVDHLQAYAVLMHEELGLAGQRWRRQALLLAAALCCLVVAAVLGGVALMLWAVSPDLPSRALGVLMGVPLAPLALAVVCLLLARQPAGAESFDNLTRQLSADMAMLRTAGTP